MKILGPLALTASLLAAGTSSAALMGGLSFVGFNQTTDADADYTGATTVTSFGTGSFIGAASLSFAPLAGPVTMTDPLQFDPFASQATFLWSKGGISFTLESVSSIDADVDTLKVIGLGSVTDGVETRPMDFKLTLNKSGTGAQRTASWSLSQSTDVPEGGVGVALLGLGLLGLAGVRRLTA
jgi:hypothetical protein